MDRRWFCWFCWFLLLSALSSAQAQDDSKKTLKINIEDKVVKCNGKLIPEPKPLTEDVYQTYTCVNDDEPECPPGEHCPGITVKVLSGESLIQLDMGPLLTVLIGDLAATVLIGWAVYSVCAQPRVRSGYQGNKASDRVNLIPNHSAGDTYQPLNTRSDEYSTLHGPRKPKNPKHAV